MPLSKKNPRYREKDEMVKDILVAIDLKRTQSISYEAAFNILHAVTYQWTQFDGMYIGNNKWSEEAIKAFNININKKAENKERLSKLVREEHIVPRRIIIEHLMDRINVNFDTVKLYLNKYLSSAIVTIEEDKRINKGLKSKMPDGIDTSSDFDEWARYKEKNIRVKKVDWIKQGRSRILVDKNIYLC